jgi:hypothetical protein
VARVFAERFLKETAFKSAYESLYEKRFPTYELFVERLAEMAAIGAENGADVRFDDINASFRSGDPLPEPRAYARYLWPEPFDQTARSELHQKIFDDYRQSHAFEHIYEDHYQGDDDFEGFVDRVAGLVVVGAVNGADDMIAKVYRALLTAAPLPPARRRPRRLR